jgi:hypothetical protein
MNNFSVQLIDKVDGEHFHRFYSKRGKVFAGNKGLEHPELVNLDVEKFSVVVQLDGLNNNEKTAVAKGVEHWVRAWNSPRFESYVKNYAYSEQFCTGALWWKKCKWVNYKEFDYNRGLNNEQIYDCLMSGKEVVGDGKIDHTAQVYLRVDRSNRRGVVGYGYPGDKWQYTYAWVFKQYSIQALADNLCHEYIHKLGFDDSSYAASRHAVTYSVGEWVEAYKD